MDVVCAASALVGLLFNCATAVKQCNELRGLYTNADRTLRSIATEASTLRTSVHHLQHLMQRDPATLSSRWDLESMLPQTFEAAIETFDNVLEALLLELGKFNFGDKAGKFTRGLKVKFLWNESAMRDLLVQLRAQGQNLQFLLSIIQMETSSDIRNAVYENQAILKKLSRLRSPKRKLQSVEEEEFHSGFSDEDMGESETFSEDDSDSEPPAKRRSVSPKEDDASGSFSPPRTRSGKIYHSSIGTSAAPVSSPIKPPTLHKRSISLQAQPAPSTKNQQTVIRSQQFRDQREERRRSTGRYGLGRSLSPASSTLSSPLTQSFSFTSFAEGSSPGWSKSSPNTQISDSETNIDTTRNGRENGCDRKEAKTDSPAFFTRRRNPGAGRELADNSTLPVGVSKEVEISMDPQMTKNPYFTDPQKPYSSNDQEYRSPQVDSDSEDDTVDSSAKTSSVTHNNISLKGSTTALPINNKNTDSKQSAEKLSQNVRPQNYLSRDKPDGYYYPTAASGSKKQSSWPRPCHEPKQRSSFSYRASHGDSNEDNYEFIEYVVDGVIYRIAQKTKPAFSHHSGTLGTENSRTPLQGKEEPQKPSPIGVATDADAKKHRIPPGYSLKNWDPSEEPIILLGSVFDANSLGKWIYDWTVYHHGPATPIADMAGEFWLLVIQLAGKVKRAEECMPRIRKEENREMVEDFIESGERVTDKLKKLLKTCETPILKDGRNMEKTQLGKNAGTEFVDSVFGRDRELEATEKFMASIRLWNMRFDANCEDILRRPGK